MTFPGKTVLKFEYTVIQLNRLPWRRFVNQHNPVAAALMAKMKMAERDRPRVKLECLRLLTTLKLDPARAKLIGGFVDSYLQLTGAELKRYEREFAALDPEERKNTMEYVTSWERNGIDKGIDIGMQRIVLHLLNRRVGSIPPALEKRISKLSADQLEKLSDAVFEIAAPADLETWLTQNEAA